MPSASIYGKAGAHDFIICIRNKKDGIGRFVTVETKAKRTDKPTDLQIDFGIEVTESGGVCYCVHDENFAEVAKEILAYVYYGHPLKGHDFNTYVRKKRRTDRRVSKPAANPSRNTTRQVH